MGGVPPSRARADPLMFLAYREVGTEPASGCPQGKRRGHRHKERTGHPGWKPCRGRVLDLRETPLIATRPGWGGRGETPTLCMGLHNTLLLTKETSDSNIGLLVKTIWNRKQISGKPLSNFC